MNYRRQASHIKIKNDWDVVLDPEKEKQPVEERRDITAVPEEVCDLVLRAARCLSIGVCQNAGSQTFSERK